MARNQCICLCMSDRQEPVYLPVYKWWLGTSADLLNSYWIGTGVCLGNIDSKEPAYIQ